MKLIDRSPGAFLAVVNALLYAVVVVECWMLTTGSILAMAATMCLILVAAGALCGWVLSLMADDEPIVVAVAEPPHDVRPLAAMEDRLRVAA